MGQNPRTTLGEHNSLITAKTIQRQFESLKLCHICASARISRKYFLFIFFFPTPKEFCFLLSALPPSALESIGNKIHHFQQREGGTMKCLQQSLQRNQGKEINKSLSQKETARKGKPILLNFDHNLVVYLSKPIKIFLSLTF